MFATSFFLFALACHGRRADVHPVDQFGKQMVRTALEASRAVETDAEVPADTRRIDLWFMPDSARAGRSLLTSAC